jgi:hypothetical protein
LSYYYFFIKLLFFIYQLSLIILKLMQSWTISKRLVLLIFILFTCVVISYGLTYTAIKVFAALSPSFGQQEISNPRYHWTNMQTGKETGTGPEYTNIHSVTYSSDGRFLNATLWHSQFYCPTGLYYTCNEMFREI